LSFSAKQEERFTKAIGSYVDLLALYPETKYKKQADKMYADASEFIGREYIEEDKNQ
jgi:hypothetical protein